MRISDWSSDVCSSDLTTSERRSARNQLVTALAEHALRTGITDYTGVAELSWLTQVLRFGWQCMPLGRVVREGSRSLAGLHFHIDDRTIASLQRGQVSEPPSFRLVGLEGGAACAIGRAPV